MRKDNLIDFPVKPSNFVVQLGCWAILTSFFALLAYASVTVVLAAAREVEKALPTDRQFYEIPEDMLHHR